MQRRTFLKGAIAMPIMSFGSKYKPAKIRRIIKPLPLKPGDQLALVAPASGMSVEKIQKCIKNVEDLGFRVKFDERIVQRTGYLAGSDIQRAEIVNQAFKSTEVKGIICIRGGYGSTRMLSLVDYRAVKRNPKVFLGFSDITAMHYALMSKTRLSGFHGPDAFSLGDAWGNDHLLSVLAGKSNIEIHASELTESAEKSYVINGGIAEGKLVGGNLTLMAALAGTGYALDLKDNIVFIEDVGEEPYRIDRMLTQLIATANLGRAAAIVLGIFTRCDPAPSRSGIVDTFTLRETLWDRLKPLRMPIVYGMPFGHNITAQCIMPMGLQVKLDADKLKMTYQEPAVQG
ncbi:MAG: LD-carboxypeptidase [Cyclobacteriaceae bacterium]|nr:LD-carboxypeptidase [Cyclobacteriaceae bacterium]